MLSSRLIDGQFPNYRQLLPDTYEHELRARRRRAHRRRAPHLPAGAEERAAAAGLPGGRADGLGPDAGHRRGARVAAGRRSRASRSRSASTPSSCATASRASSRGDVVLKLITPLRPGLIQAADERGFLYLHHADPPQRLASAPMRIVRLALRNFRTYARADVELGRADGRHRPQRRRQDEPARGALLRLHRALLPDDQRARAGALRRGAHARRGDARGRRRRRTS